MGMSPDGIPPPIWRLILRSKLILSYQEQERMRNLSTEQRCAAIGMDCEGRPAVSIVKYLLSKSAQTKQPTAMHRTVTSAVRTESKNSSLTLQRGRAQLSARHAYTPSASMTTPRAPTPRQTGPAERKPLYHITERQQQSLAQRSTAQTLTRATTPLRRSASGTNGVYRGGRSVTPPPSLRRQQERQQPRGDKGPPLSHHSSTSTSRHPLAPPQYLPSRQQKQQDRLERAPSTVSTSSPQPAHPFERHSSNLSTSSRISRTPSATNSLAAGSTTSGGGPTGRGVSPRRGERWISQFLSHLRAIAMSVQQWELLTEEQQAEHFDRWRMPQLQRRCVMERYPPCDKMML